MKIRTKSIDLFKKRRILYFLPFVFLLAALETSAQPAQRHWSAHTRKIRYTPDHGDFVIVNGEKRFNRALYGSHTGFRVEAGDLPEFALYMPRLGGTLRLGLQTDKTSKWLIEADSIETRYNRGSMRYQIHDRLLGNGTLKLKLLALADADGMILQFEGKNLPEDLKLFWLFGGASDKRFSREGDLGADPESVFYLSADNCKTNEYVLCQNSFDLYYGTENRPSDNEINENNTPGPAESEASRLNSKKKIFGLFPQNSIVKQTDATRQESPDQSFNAETTDFPSVCGQVPLTNTMPEYLLLLNPDTRGKPNDTELSRLFDQAEEARQQLASHFRIHTPDEYINAAGSAMAAAADGIWDDQAFMHGAVAWRMPLNGWRGAYAADWLGWPDRAETHFRNYFAAQYTEPKLGPGVPDPKTHLARQKEEIGTSLFTEGYISRNPGKISKPHHYDMNLVFISQLLWHYRWTGDTAFIRQSWPVLQRHLAWEKRNFDADDNGLYDAYCCIWASDALQYSGGGVTHASAYNYRANLMAAELAPIIGKDPHPFLAEAEKIKTAVNKNLWLPQKGWFAEYKDLLGLQRGHPSAAVWTIYHAIDEGLADPFQAWQSTIYIDHAIPRIPIKGKGLPPNEFYTISTTNWMPYTWSINNVAMAEVLHTALAYWQSGRSTEAFQLTKGTLLDFMFMGSCPGNFGQLSYYDAFRGELYRDFADPIGVASRVFVEGLFGFSPNLLQNEINLNPGWPADWAFAEMETPYLKMNFTRNENTDTYKIENRFGKTLQLNLALPARAAGLHSFKVNGRETAWTSDENAVGEAVISVKTPKDTSFQVEIVWDENPVEKISSDSVYAQGSALLLRTKKAEIVAVNDPQKLLINLQHSRNQLSAKLSGESGGRTFFIQLKQGKIRWWQPISFELKNPIEFIYTKNQPGDKIQFSVRNNTGKLIDGLVLVNGFKRKIAIPAKAESDLITVEADQLITGSNPIEFQTGQQHFTGKIINWKISAKGKFETVSLTNEFNDQVTNLFSEQYLSPRSPYPTLAIPVQGIGDWCSYNETEKIDDSGLRQKAEKTNKIDSPQGIPFTTPSAETKNIAFTSQWDVYPESMNVPLTGKASHAYLLMAGSMHHMRVNMINGTVEVIYTDGSRDSLELKSPDNWWPIEQDYYEDGFAFKLPAASPPRLYLKTGEWHLDSSPVLAKNKTIKIEGGAASLLDLPLNPDKELKSLHLRTLSNDLVIGLMAVTLKRTE